MIRHRRSEPSAIWTPGALDDQAYAFAKGVAYLHEEYMLFFDLTDELGNYQEPDEAATRDEKDELLNT